MNRHLTAGVLASLLAASPSYASEVLTPAEARIRGCITMAADAYRLPASLVLILL